MLIVAWMVMCCPWHKVVSKDCVFPQSEHEAVEEFEHFRRCNRRRKNIHEFLQSNRKLFCCTEVLHCKSCKICMQKQNEMTLALKDKKSVLIHCLVFLAHSNSLTAGKVAISSAGTFCWQIWGLFEGQVRDFLRTEIVCEHVLISKR